MVKKITPEAAVTFTKVMVALSFSWPLPKSASRFQTIRFKTLRFLCCANALTLVLPVIYTLYLNDYDIPKISKLYCLLGAFVQVPLQISLCGLQYDRLQYLTAVMERSFKCADLREKETYQRYADGCAMFYACSMFMVFLTACGVSIFAPLVTPDQTFPTEAKYPFDVMREPLRTIIFIHQFVVIWQCCSIVCLGSFIGLLVWFASARFDLLSQQFNEVTNAYDIIACIRQHHEVLRYAREVIIAVRSVMLSIVVICSETFVFSGLTIVSQSTLEEKIQFAILWITGLMEVFMCAWPADHLMNTSADVAQAAYGTPWYNQDMIFQRNIWYILMRSQIPVVLSVSSFLPALSLNYYASYVSTVFSYLMTLRIVFVDEAE